MMNAPYRPRAGADLVVSPQLTFASDWSDWRTARQVLGRHACTLALVVSDLAACALTFACASRLEWAFLAHDADLPTQSAGAFAIVAAAMLVWLASKSHYHRRIPFWTETQHLTVAILGALLCSGCLDFLLHQTPSRALLIITWAMLAAVILAMRRLTRGILSRHGLWQIKTIIVGAGEVVPQTIDALRSEPGLGYQVTRVIAPTDLAPNGVPPCWRTLLRHNKADLLILALDGAESNANVIPVSAMIDTLVRQRVPFAMVPPSAGLPVLGFERTAFFSHDTVICRYRNNLARPVARATKIVLDLALVAVAMIVLAPVFLAIAAAVKLDGGPAFYAHTRIGAGGRSFRCLKFRSMVMNSADVLADLLATDPAAAAEWAETQKLRDDPRITRVGKLLRKTSLDELPQLFNVLRLEMSLVGPRPIVTNEVARYGEDIAYYFETRPGITGLWQVSGRNSTSYNQRVQLDTWYVKNWTIWHDVAILAKTIPAVLQRRGAY